MLDVSQEDITKGSIPRALMLLAAPLLLQNLVHVANNIIDTFWVGRLGEDAVAAVGLNFPVIAFLGAAIVLVAVGTQILVAQRIGNEARTAARQIAANGILLALAVGVGIAVVLLFLSEWAMAILSGDPDVAPLAAIYLATYVAFFPFALVSDTVENAFIGWGDTKAPLYINVAMVGTNVVLDPFLIFGWLFFPALGVQGAALASGISFVVALVLGLLLASGIRDSFTLRPAAFDVDYGLFREILEVGVPLGGQRAVGQVVRVLVVGLVALAGGAAGVAAYTVGARVAAVAVIPALGLQQAAQSMIGQNLGADRPGRAFRTTAVGVAVAAIALTLLGAVQWVVPDLIVNVLVPDLTARGHELSVLYLRILALSYWALGVTYIFLAGFNGASRTTTSFVVDLLKYWGVRFPIAVLAIPAGATLGAFGIAISPGFGWGVEAVFWAVTVSNVIAAVGVGAYFFYTSRDGMFVRAAESAGEATAND